MTINKQLHLPLLLILLVSLVSGGLPWGQPSVVYAAPDTEVRQPDGDISDGGWDTTPLWSKIDEGSGSPDGTYIVGINNKNYTGEVSVQDPSNYGNYTAVQIKVYARKSAAGGNQRGLDADIRIATSLQGQQTLQVDLTEIFTEYTYTWTGLSFSQADMNSLQILFISTGTLTGPNKREVHIDYYEIILTYTLLVPPDISNTPTSFAFGTLAASSTTETGLTWFTVTNNSGFTVNITISGTDMSGGTTPWELSEDGTAGADIYGLKAGTPALGDYTITVPEDSANTLVSGLADTGTQQWGLQLLAPTAFSDGTSKSGTVTLTATQP